MLMGDVAGQVPTVRVAASERWMSANKVESKHHIISPTGQHRQGCMVLTHYHVAEPDRCCFVFRANMH